MANGDALDPQTPAQEGVQGRDLATQWRGFIGEPSNRAFLIQAGLAMLQPRGTGQSTLGHIAGALGQGGEAAGRVQLGEERRDIEAERQAERRERTDIARGHLGVAEREAQTRERLAEQGLGGRGGGVTGNAILSGRLRAQAEVQKWIGEKPDPFALEETPDYRLAAIQRQFPELTTKGEAVQAYYSRPEVRDYMLGVFGGDVLPAQGQQLQPRPGATVPTSPTPPAPGAVLRPDKTGRMRWYRTTPDGKTEVWE